MADRESLFSARDLSPDLAAAERICDERLEDLYADAPTLASNSAFQSFMRAAYAQGLCDASARPFPFSECGYRTPPSPSPYAWAIGKTFPSIPQVMETEPWGGAFKELHAELEAMARRITWLM